MIKVCIIGLDFAVLEQRVMARARNLGLGKVVCIAEADIGAHTDIDAILIDETVNRADYLQCTGGIPVNRLLHSKRLYLISPKTILKQEPHWVTRNAKGRRY
jgi:hypothetical protein